MRLLLTSLLLFPFVCLFSQSQDGRTVGVISHAGLDRVQEGYNLFYPHNQPNVYLLDNCGRTVHLWEDQTGFVPGNTAYILPDGNLVKTKRAVSSGPNNPIWAGGAGETIELLSWDNELLASFTLNDDSLRLHHDVSVLPNGNVLAIAWEAFDYAESVAAGRDTALLPDSVVWAEAILEIDLLADTIVWRWRAWDHLVQDYDINAENFADVDDNPGRIDLNYVIQGGTADWLHFNAIDYNEELDQIILSVPHFDEIWIIDHSTTTAEAATDRGGRSDRGGELLYRWGNPRAFRSGVAADQRLYFQHDIAWIDNFLSAEDSPYFGQLSVFNNRTPGMRSTANVIDPGFDTATWSYPIINGRFLPDTFSLTLDHPTNPEFMFSGGLSGVQPLANGNWLITAGRPGYSFELDPTGSAIVWQFRNPILGGQRQIQGTDISGANNTLFFRLPRYPLDFPAFEGRDLSPGDYLEIAPDSTLCASLVTATREPLSAAEKPQLYPNPTNNVLSVDWPSPIVGECRVLDLYGRTVWRSEYSSTTESFRLRVGDWPAGMYSLHWNGRLAGRFLVY